MMATTVRLAGRITDWNEEKGFGFVVPNGGGERAFVHINEFERGSRRPVPGDLISYLPAKDARDRPQARGVRHAGPRANAQQQPSRLPRAVIGLVLLGIVAGAALAELVPMPLVVTYAVMSAVSYVMYRSDKSAASRGARRTPENSLHLSDLLGGWPGALVAQKQFRHKTIKQPFQSVFWVTVLANLTAAWWLVSSGVAADLGQLLSAK